MTSLQTDKDVIYAIGIDALVPLHEKQSRFAVQKWAASNRGIPWRYRAMVAEVAKSKRIKIPADFATSRPIAEPSRKRTRRAA